MSDQVSAAWRAYRSTESTIHAWVEVNPQDPLGNGPLSGIPFGVKDIFETRGLATEYGSELYRGRRGEHDAAAVTSLRKLGAVLFGKTQTTAFAYFDPPPTRNPRDPAHTPGGSSSGSAAAVAAGVVPFALGTQTMGSVIRPSSFCGVAGFKPTFGVLSREGVLPFAPSLDTVGLLAESAEFCGKVWSALGFRTSAMMPRRFGVPANLPAVSQAMQSAFDHALELIKAGYEVETVTLPVPYERLLNAARIINDYEGARTHQGRWKQFGERIGAKLAELVVRGLRIDESEYRDRLGLLDEARKAMKPIFADVPVLLTPAALGAAPRGFSSTGDPAMNAVWTALGTPAATIPTPRRDGRLPLGLQMIGAKNSDAVVLKAAVAIEKRFARERKDAE
jgi:Asp-tRNA(Asn)/Glu-tRNA(Gln) amidotransferase A subunit family amidase